VRDRGHLLYGLYAWLDADQRTEAINAFSRAAEADPGFMPALGEIATGTEEQEINQRPQIALRAFRRGMDTEAARDPLFHLYLGRLERAFGSVTRSLEAFHRYRELGGDEGLALLETARSAFLTDSLADSLDAADSYYRGAGVVSRVAADGYRADLEPIVTDSELAAFDRTAGEARVEFLRDFWTARDDADLRHRGARLREHYRRLAFARKAFPRSPFTRRYGFGDYYQTNHTAFDDRGVIYVRHGAPTMRRHLIVPSSEAYGAEGWRYVTPEGKRDYFFLATDDPQDYRLRPSALDLPLGNRTDFLYDFDPRLTTATGSTLARYAQELFIEGKDNIVVGTSTDSYTLSFDEPLEALVQIVTAGATRDHNVLHLALAVPIEQLAPTDDGRGPPIWPVTVRARVTDTAGAVVARIDTTHLWHSGGLGDGSYLLDLESVTVPIGPLVVRLAVNSDTRGGVFPPDTIDVLGTPDRASGGSSVAMSRPVLGVSRQRVAWPIPQSPDSVFFNPLDSFSRRGSMEVYYELFGLVPEVNYTTLIEVIRKGGGLLGGGGGTKISLSFQQASHGAVTRVSRTLSLKDVDSGTYLLRLSLTGPDGAAVEYTRQFEVVE